MEKADNNDRQKLSWGVYSAVLDLMDNENAIEPKNKEIASKMQGYFDELLGELYATEMRNTELDEMHRRGI